MPGNIVAFAGDGGWIIHRVVHCGRRGKAAGYLLTRGDNRTLPDGPVARERVAGLVTAMCVDKEWVPPPPAGPPAFVARLSVGFLKVLLETSPALAVALARVGGGLRRIYVAPRRIVARLLRRTPR